MSEIQCKMRTVIRWWLAVLIVAGALTLAAAGMASADPGEDGTTGQQTPPHGSCAAFGGNVSGLAQALGPDFGAAASGVASSAPGAFPTVVVKPEQSMYCEPRP